MNNWQKGKEYFLKVKQSIAKNFKTLIFYEYFLSKINLIS